MTHKAGFVSIIGKPNVGKSTLMNALVGEKLSIVTSKVQTTRHRILGILNGADFQIVFSDTPGIIKPRYKLHEAMMRFVSSSFVDADVILFITDIFEKNNVEEIDQLSLLQKVKVPIVLVLNKIDLLKDDTVSTQMNYWMASIQASAYIAISALKGINTDKVLNTIIKHLPQSPAFYPKDELTDKPERFFVAEMIREQIFVTYKQEVPYSTEVVIEAFREDENITRIRADIIVNRKSQKPILIGKEGMKLKKVGTAARKNIEAFLEKKVYLELYVKVREDWRNNPNFLRNFGYK